MFNGRGRDNGGLQVSMDIGRAFRDSWKAAKANGTRPEMLVRVPLYNLTSIPSVFDALEIGERLFLASRNPVPPATPAGRRRGRYRSLIYTLLQQQSSMDLLDSSGAINPVLTEFVTLDFACMVFNSTTGEWGNSSVISSNYSASNGTVACTLDVSDWEGTQDVVAVAVPTVLNGSNETAPVVQENTPTPAQTPAGTPAMQENTTTPAETPAETPAMQENTDSRVPLE